MLIYVSPLIVSAVFGIVLVFLISRNRLVPSSIALVALILAATLWSFGYALEFLSPALETKLFWAKFQYFGITTIPLAWFVFAVRYMGSPGWLARPLKFRALLGVIPLITLVLVWTNELHGLIWRKVQLQMVGSLQLLELDHGPAFWVYLVFSYGLLIIGSAKLVEGLLGSVRLYRWQIRLALLATLIPWFGNLVYVTGLNPVEHLDWTPFSFIVAGLLFTISLFHYQLIEVLPIAEKTVFAGLPDCLLVLDIQDCLLDLNRAAERMIGITGKVPIGKPLAEFMPELASWVSLAGSDKEFQVEISRGEKPDQRFYELRVIPLYGPYTLSVGRLIVCHEITQHKQEQSFLEQVVAERTTELRQAVEQLQHELAQRTLAERRFEEVIESAPDATLLVDQSGTIILVNTQVERLFGYSRTELLEQNIECLIALNRREVHRSYVDQFIANPLVKQIGVGLTSAAQRKDGSVFPVEISLGPVNTSDGVWVACSIRDITERKKAEEEQNQLLEEIKQSREQLRLLAIRLQEVQEIERRQIASELHDRIGQNLTGLNLNLQIVENQLGSKFNPVILNRLADALKLVEETTRQVRDVMADLHPPMLDEYGLVSALNWFCTNFSMRTGIAARVKGDEFEPRLPSNDEMVLFRIVQEALNNVAKHAHATRAEIFLESYENAACLKIQDDGMGFDPQVLETLTDQPHWGLINMEQRVASIGGQLSVDSAPGCGTQVSILVMRSQNEG